MDYANWMLDDPRINFAISRRAMESGVDHLGFQVNSAEELLAMERQLRDADFALLTKSDTVCCFARSDKQWTTDPQGVAWKTFHTLGTSDTYSAPTAEAACCTPKQSLARPTVDAPKSACC